MCLFLFTKPFCDLFLLFCLGVSFLLLLLLLFPLGKLREKRGGGEAKGQLSCYPGGREVEERKKSDHR